MLALSAAVLAVALASPPVLPAADHTTRTYQLSLEGRKGAEPPLSPMTRGYALTLTGSPQLVTGPHTSYAGRDDPAPPGEPAAPSPGMIVLMAALALVGAGALLVAPQWLRGR